MYRTDGNHKQLMEFARKIGFSVTSTAMVGNGFPDIVLGIYGLNFLPEIKDPSKPPSARKLTYMEQKWHEEWLGSSDVIMTEEDLIKLKSVATQMRIILDTFDIATSTIAIPV